ncbi:acid phosphatase [Legionella jordanis]|nr:HAD family acid phosphatase [Legionella jordanis]RMX03849.1 acid phosphatase [Legionella jordanis]RMX22286.1 acid phosphatase [Legionella jordanis]HAT8712772.1 acid phosphatase [Legionella jordanis]
MRSITRTLVAITWLACFAFPSYSEPGNLSVLKSEIKQYHDSGSYQKELERVLYQAQDYILKQAEINQKQKNPKKLAIVLDIDETSISNYNSIIHRDFGADLNQIHKDILEANAPVIAPTLALYKAAMEHNVAIFFVTGRHLSELKATRLNLLRAGFKNWAGLYLRPDTYRDSSIVPFKTKARESITKQGYTIVASIGDQQSDLKGGYMQKGFKLPNPFYHLP